MANCELFGKFAEYFESQVVPLWQGVYDSLVDRAGVGPGSKVLDVGTGTGEVALRMSRLVGQSGLVLGVDTVDEMLEIARRKAKTHGTGNMRFENMSAERLSLADASFDFVVGNYSLCCFLDYQAALKECQRVLKPGGRLTYNHNGPEDSLEFQLIFEIFEAYKTKKPSDRLRQIRESNIAQTEAWEKYRVPQAALKLIKSLGFEHAEASSTQRVLKYRSPEAYLDRMLGFNWRNEASEMRNEDLLALRSEALEALAPFSKGSKFLVKDDMVYFTGLKG